MNILDFAGPIEIKHRNPDCVSAKITTSLYLSQPQIDRFLILKFHLQSPLIAEFDIGTWQSKKVQTSEMHITLHSTHTLSINIYTFIDKQRTRTTTSVGVPCRHCWWFMVAGRGLEKGGLSRRLSKRISFRQKNNFDI